MALRLAYEAVQKAVDCGGVEAGNYDDQAKVDSALDVIAQRLYERWKQAEARLLARSALKAQVATSLELLQ